MIVLKYVIEIFPPEVTFLESSVLGIQMNVLLLEEHQQYCASTLECLQF